MFQKVRRIVRSIQAGCATLLVNLCLLASLAGAQTDATYTNPVIAGDYPDPSVIRVGEDYWAAATSGDWSPYFPILHSRDLVNWKTVGAVFKERPRWTLRNFWAPEIAEDGKRFFVYYTARRDEGPQKKGTLCVAVATAPHPAGPYTDHGPLVCQKIGSIDAFATRDENNQRYLIWKEDGNDRNQPTLIWAQPLSEDGTKLRGKAKEIMRNDAPWERHVVEGSFIIRRGQWFYHFYSGNACCGRSCNYALGVARSRKLLGPWEKNPRNPILAANDAWQCPGHGSIVTTPDGRDFLLYHAYRQSRDAFSIGREALLDEIKWNNADGWPSINEGKGPSRVARSALPLSGLRPAQTEFFDGFTSRLEATWQWPMRNQQAASIEVAPGGYLQLAAAAKNRADDILNAVLGQRTTSSSYVATAALKVEGMPAGTNAGLAAYSDSDAAVGVAVGNGKVFVWRREEKQPQQQLATATAPAASLLYLRMSVLNGEQYRFAFSANGRDWKELGPAVEGSHLEGTHVALTCGGTTGAVARFDWLRITPTIAMKE